MLEVEKGLAQIDSGQTLSHEEVGARLNKHLTGNRPPPLMQLRWTEEAANDLERIADYLLLHTPVEIHRSGELIE